MIPSYDELFEAYLICDKERYELLDKKHELEAKQIINEQEKDKEIDRLNNIINELEKESYLGMVENQNNNDYSKGLYCAYEYINKRIKELKEDNK